MTWDNKSNYEYTKMHNNIDWGWEFLRRNLLYIEEWKEEMDKHSNNSKPLNYIFDVPDVSYLNQDLNSRPINLIDPTKIETFMLPTNAAFKWGLHYLQNPKSEMLNEYAVQHSRTYFQPLEEPDDYIEFYLQAGDFISIIEIEKPIAPQLKDIEIQLKGLKNSICPSMKNQRAAKKSQNSWNNFVEYLRVLDALTADVSRAVAAPEIFDTKGMILSPLERWDEVLKQAKLHRDKNFLRLLRYSGG